MLSSLTVHLESTPSILVDRRVFEATTDVGLRPSQEDRLVLIPSFARDHVSFCGVFDGTVGDDASEFVSKNIVAHLCNAINEHDPKSSIFEYDMSENTTGDAVEIIAEKTRKMLKQCFHSTDEALIRMCAEKQLHYASSTGVAALLVGNLLTIAHVGDSRACIAREINKVLTPEWLTVDHKPNVPHELKRIEQSGGSLTYLHGNKPYIRGGDFFPRQIAGEHPKQLNYSRAFGGKDLKMFGLSVDPDISHFELTSDDKLVILASDGLWDVLDPRDVMNIAMKARAEGKNATKEIVKFAIQEMPSCNVRDNITVLAIFL